MASSNTLHSQVVQVASGYLGPAAPRFVNRQIRTHLDKNPKDLTRSDLKKLIDWIDLAVALLTENSQIADEFSESLKELTRTPR